MMPHLGALFLLNLVLASSNAAKLGITGGASTTIQKHPYQAAIDLNGVLVCGGAIIDKRWIITAATCINEAPVTVRVGAQFREETGESFSVTDFKTIGKVALLQLDDDIDLRTEAQVISLVQEGQSTAQGDVLLVSGYGDLFDGEQRVAGQLRQLQVTSVPVIANDICNDAYQYIYPYTGLSGPTVCAGSTGKGICGQRDLGDPLVNWKGELVGLAYAARGCGRPALPTAFVDLSDSDIQQFVKDTLRPAPTSSAPTSSAPTSPDPTSPAPTTSLP